MDRDITIQILSRQLEELNKRVNRLEKENKAVLVFAFIPEVPFTNNLAE